MNDASSSKMTIAQKIICGFAILIAILIAVSATSIVISTSIRKKVELLHSTSLVRLEALDGIKQAVLTNRYLFLSHIASTNPQEMTATEARMKENSAGASERYKAYEATLTDEQDRAEYATIVDFRKRYIETRAKVMEMSQKGDKAGANAEFQATLAPLLDGYVQAVQKLSNDVQEDTRVFTDVIRRETLFSQNLMIWSTALTLVLAVVTSWLIIRSTNATLRQVAADLTEGSDQLSCVAESLSTASQSLAEGTSHQAASIEETSASLEQISALGKQNQDRTVSASDSAGRTRKAVDIGLGDVNSMAATLEEVGNTSREMETAMQAMRSSSNDIAKIIKTIDEIAFQTNILALNAAVEAARAGESGAGFAVVAEEVRALAQRSAEAAKNTSTLIESTIQRSHAGAQISEKVATTVGALLEKSALVQNRLKEIASLVQDVNGISNEVASSTSEQTTGITQISTAVHDIDTVTQKNAATSEETAAAAEELSAQAVTLRGNVLNLMALIDSSLAKRASLEGGVGSPALVGGRTGRAERHLR
ncbi:methyl-accepting chemotaxis protein [Verrucomicrobium sp. GAS474]|uniref:HAMP domain-containing methyl-accepting chemotaxis protein n=1 Tax=Verrucomicrobium sp. GAS474 TaxID=1882831 RepID=UPI00087A20CF|nr:methyl-accepting chemotaxis protein [Verrucomicrobium sp. GAS474]SDU30054.1 methyl-accepting chemotaxis protein [Verrucomicrobium sp. GAS474]